MSENRCSYFDPNRKNDHISFSKKIKTECINSIADFLISRFGIKPNQEQYEIVSKAAVLLIPELHSGNDNDGGIVSIMYNNEKT